MCTLKLAMAKADFGLVFAALKTAMKGILGASVSCQKTLIMEIVSSVVSQSSSGAWKSPFSVLAI